MALWVEGRDLLALCLTCKRFAALLHDEMFWRTKCLRLSRSSAEDKDDDWSWRRYYALLSAEYVYTFGSNYNKQLGIGYGSRTRESIEPLKTSLGSVIRASQVSCGHYHTTVISTEGQLYTFGSNTQGRLGDGTVEDRGWPTPINIPGGAAQVSSGASHTGVVNTRGELYMFGNNTSGQITGIWSTYSRPIIIPLRCRVRKVVCGRFHTAFITFRSELYAFGSVWGSKPLRLITPSMVREVSCGKNLIMAVSHSGQLYAYGHPDPVIPELIYVPNQSKVKTVSCKFDYTCFVCEDGKVFSSLRNSFMRRLVTISVPGKARLVKCGPTKAIIVMCDGRCFSYHYVSGSLEELEIHGVRDVSLGFEHDAVIGLRKISK